MKILIGILAIFIIVICYSLLRTGPVREKNDFTSITNLYLKKIGLDKLETSSDVKFEIRIWSPFLNDSFPVILKRIYVSSGSLKCDVYIFKSNEKVPIKSYSTIGSNNFSYTKYSIKKLSVGILDTLTNYLNLHIILPEKERSYITIDNNDVINKPLYCMLEEVINGSYRNVFLPIPKYLTNAKEFDQYRIWYNFIDEEIFNDNPEATNWIDSQLAELFALAFVGM